MAQSLEINTYSNIEDSLQYYLHEVHLTKELISDYWKMINYLDEKYPSWRSDKWLTNLHETFISKFKELDAEKQKEYASSEELRRILAMEVEDNIAKDISKEKLVDKTKLLGSLKEQKVFLGNLSVKENLTDKDFNSIDIGEVRSLLSWLLNEKEKSIDDELSILKNILRNIKEKYVQKKNAWLIKGNSDLETLFAIDLEWASNLSNAINLAEEYAKLNLSQLSIKLSEINNKLSQSSSKTELKESKHSLLMVIMNKLSSENTVVKYDVNTQKYWLFDVIKWKSVNNISINQEDLQTLSILVSDDKNVDYSENLEHNAFLSVVEKYNLKKPDWSTWIFETDFRAWNVITEAEANGNRKILTSQLDSEIAKLNKAISINGKLKDKENTKDPNLVWLQRLEMVKASINIDGWLNSESVKVASDTINEWKKFIDIASNKWEKLYDVLMWKIPAVMLAGILYWIAWKLFDWKIKTAIWYAILWTLWLKTALDLKEAWIAEWIDFWGDPKWVNKWKTHFSSMIDNAKDTLMSNLTDKPNGNFSSKFSKAYSRLSELNNKEHIFDVDKRKLDQLFILASSDKSFLDKPKSKTWGLALFSDYTKNDLIAKWFTDSDINHFVTMLDVANPDHEDKKFWDLFVDWLMDTEVVFDDKAYFAWSDENVKSRNERIRWILSWLDWIPYNSWSDSFSEQDYEKSPKANIQKILSDVNPWFTIQWIKKAWELWSDLLKDTAWYDITLFDTLWLSSDDIEKVVKKLEQLKTKTLFSSNPSYIASLDKIIGEYKGVTLEVKAKKEVNDFINKYWPEWNITSNVKNLFNDAWEWLVNMSMDMFNNPEISKNIADNVPHLNTNSNISIDVWLQELTSIKAKLATEYSNIPNDSKEVLEKKLKEIEVKMRTKKVDLWSKDINNVEMMIKLDTKKVQEQVNVIGTKFTSILSVTDKDDLEDYLPKLMISQKELDLLMIYWWVNKANLTTPEQKNVVELAEKYLDSYKTFREKLSEKSKKYQEELDALPWKISSNKTPEELRQSLISYLVLSQNLKWGWITRDGFNKIKQLSWYWASVENTKDLLSKIVTETDIKLWFTWISSQNFDFMNFSPDYVAKLDVCKNAIKAQANKIIDDKISSLWALPTVGSNTDEIKDYLWGLKSLSETVDKIRWLGYKNSDEKLKWKQKEFIGMLKQKMLNTSSNDMPQFMDMFEELDLSYFQDDYWFKSAYKERIKQIVKEEIYSTKLKDLWLKYRKIRELYDDFLANVNDSNSNLLKNKVKRFSDTDTLNSIIEWPFGLRKNMWDPKYDKWWEITKFIKWIESELNGDLLPFMDVEWRFKRFEGKVWEIWSKALKEVWEIAWKVPSFLISWVSTAADTIWSGIWTVFKESIWWLLSAFNPF